MTPTTSLGIGPAGATRAFTNLALIIAGALCLLLPAIWNGYPFIYFDTVEYHSIGGGIVSHLTGIVEGAPAAMPAAAPLAAALADTNESLTYAGGRSPYYSLLIYLSDLIGPMWITAAVQALLAAGLLFLIARGVRPDRPARTYAIVIGGLTLASSLPYYAAFIMPDILTGVAIIGSATLAVWYGRLSLAERIAVVLVAAFATASHGTNAPLVALALLILVLGAMIFRSANRSFVPRAAWAIAPLVLGIAASAAYGMATKIIIGEAPHNPPYLMARVLADGPGRAYLDTACATAEPFEICRYKTQPLTAHNDILWSTDPRIGVFQLADSASKRRMIQQERAFVIAAITAYPGQQIAASAHASLEQLHTFSIGADFGLARESWEQVNSGAFMPTETAAATASKAFHRAYPFQLVDALQLAGIIASLGFLAWRLSRADAMVAYRQREGAIAIFATASVGVVLILIANAILCGSLSGVHARYQGRITWLLPLMALLVLVRFGMRPKAPAATAPRP